MGDAQTERSRTTENITVASKGESNTRGSQSKQMKQEGHGERWPEGKKPTSASTASQASYSSCSATGAKRALVITGTRESTCARQQSEPPHRSRRNQRVRSRAQPGSQSARQTHGRTQTQTASARQGRTAWSDGPGTPRHTRASTSSAGSRHFTAGRSRLVSTTRSSASITAQATANAAVSNEETREGAGALRALR